MRVLPTLLLKVQIRGDSCCLEMGWVWEPPAKDGLRAKPSLSLLSFLWEPGPEDLGCCGVTEVERSGPCCWGHGGQLGWALMPRLGGDESTSMPPCIAWSSFGFPGML